MSMLWNVIRVFNTDFLPLASVVMMNIPGHIVNNCHLGYFLLLRNLTSESLDFLLTVLMKVNCVLID